MSGNHLILAIDQGTTNTKALLVASDGRVLHQASVPNTVTYPHPGWAEQSAMALVEGVRQVIAEVVAKAGGAAGISGLAISNQRESIVVWDAATGEPIGPCIIWQCRRSAERCEALRAAGHAEFIESRTGLALDPLFPAAKIGWLLDTVPGARIRAERGELRAGTVDSWLIWVLTGGAHITDHSNAARTQLFDLATLSWNGELCGLFNVPMGMLPEVRSSDAGFGRLAEGVTALPAGLPILAMLGDSHAALFGHGVREPGTVKATYGTGTSLMTLTSDRIRSTRRLSSTIAWSQGGCVSYALEGNISVSGQSAAFIAELLGLSDAAALAALAETVPDSNGVAFVPALVGLGAPYWRADARGTITGLTLGTRPAHLARAAIEAIAFQVADVFDAMGGDAGIALDELRADGGASRNGTLMQFQADILGRPVTAAAAPEVSALGAAAMAFASLGITMPPVAAAERYSPAIEGTARQSHRRRWKAAITQTLAEHKYEGEQP